MSAAKENEEDSSIPPEELEFLRDLRAYDNPEVFDDASLPQHYKFRITDFNLSDLPTLLDIVINGEALPNALRETMFMMIQRDPNFEKDGMKLYGTKDIAEIRAILVADEEYLEGELEMRRFFVRHFPKLAVHVYNIAILISIMSVSKLAFVQPKEREEWESQLKPVLKNMLRLMERDIKQWLGTRRRGGSAAKLTEEIRTSLYEYYDDILLVAKPIKKDYNDTFKRFDESRPRGYNFEEWQQFWINHATGLYHDYDKDFLTLFADQDHPSASEVAYRWLAYRTGRKKSYVERLVKQTRKDAGKARPRKVTMKQPE